MQKKHIFMLFNNILVSSKFDEFIAKNVILRAQNAPF